MAMSGAVLGPALKSAVDAIGPPVPPETVEQYRDRLFRALGDAIVAHITTNAVVTVASVSGVTPGPGVSGAGAGTVA
jgi:hypothetical protein